jgi:hypothetical protein
MPAPIGSTSEKVKKDTKIATIIDSPYLPEEKARFSIIETGVRDSDII